MTANPNALNFPEGLEMVSKEERQRVAINEPCTSYLPAVEPNTRQIGNAFGTFRLESNVIGNEFSRNSRCIGE
jgi:hypothetical protein